MIILISFEGKKGYEFFLSWFFMCFMMDINFYHFVTECRNQFSNL